MTGIQEPPRAGGTAAGARASGATPTTAPRGRRGRGAARSPWFDPGRRGERLGVLEFPTFLLGRVSGLARRSLIPRYVEPFGLSLPEWRLLASLAEGAAMSVTDLCRVVTMDRGQVSRTVPALVSKGLVERTVAVRRGPRGRGEAERQVKLRVTAGGRALYRRILPVARRHQMVLLHALDAGERETLYTMLQKLIAAAEQFEEFPTIDSERHRRAPRAQHRTGVQR